MLTQLIQHSRTRSTREVHTNFPNSFSHLYNSLTPRNIPKPLLPPLSPVQVAETSLKLKKILYEKKIMKEISAIKEHKERIFKGKLAERLWNDFSILIQHKWLNESAEDIVERGLYIYKIRQMNESAKKIQRKWKNFLFKREKKRLNLIKNKAAAKIQKAFRVYFKEIVIPFRTKQIEQKSAVLIQKFFRGYSERMKFSVIRAREKLRKNLNYLEKIREEVVTESVKIIQRFWKKYLRNKGKNKPAKSIGNRFAKAVKSIRGRKRNK